VLVHFQVFYLIFYLTWREFC